MADVDPRELLHTMQDLIRTIRDNSLSGGFTLNKKKTNIEKFAEDRKNKNKINDDSVRMQKAVQDSTKAIKEAMKQQTINSKDMKVTGALFQNAVQKLSLKSFDELPARINALTKDYQFNFQSASDIQKALSKYTQENINELKTLHEEYVKAGTTQERMNEINTKLVKIWGEDWHDAALQSIEDLEGAGRSLKQAVLTDSKAIEDAAKRTSKMSVAANVAEVALGWLGAQAIETTKATAKFGVDFIPLGKDMKFLGMSAEELATIQNQNIQGIRNLGKGFGDFDDKLKTGAYDLLEFTGSLPEGARLTAGLFQSFRMISKQNDTDLTSSIRRSTNIFKEMHDTVGETAEQFQQLTQMLQSNSEIQVNMYRLGQGQRAQAMIQLQQQAQELRNLGLLDSEAQGVIATFAELGAEGPKERRKKAAQLMAVGGALGMGSEARQLAALIQAGDTSSPEFVKLATAMQQRAQQQYANVKGTAGEFAQYELTNKIPQLLGQRGPVAALAMRQGMAIGAADQTRAIQHATGMTPTGQLAPQVWTDKWRDILIKAVVGTEDILRGVFGTGLVGIIGTVWAAMKAKGFIGRMIGGGAAEGVTLGGGAGGTAAGAGLAATAATVGSIVAAVAASGTALYSVVQAVRGKDASNWISDFDAQNGIIGKSITNGLSAVFGPKLNSPQTFRNYNKDTQVMSMIEKYKADEAKNDKVDMDKMLKAMDALVTSMAIADKRDPAKAVENLHKTIQQQHHENKQMTQEQTDAIKNNKKVELKRTSTPTPVGHTS